MNFSSFFSLFSLSSFFIFLIFAVVLFFVFREITLWYFRINENTDSLRRIADSLALLASVKDNDQKKETDLKPDVNQDQQSPK
jgi:preprotein translocase subunit SecY